MRKRRTTKLHGERLPQRQMLSATAFEFNDVGYLLNPTLARIERFDIDGEAWLPPITLQGAAARPTAILADDDGIYALINRKVFRFNSDGSGIRELFEPGFVPHTLHADGDILFINQSVATDAHLTSINKSTGAFIANYNAYVDSVMGSSISRTANRIFGRLTAFSPSDLTYVTYNDSGEFIDGGDGPYHGAYAPAVKTWAFPSGSKVVDNSGTVYATDSLLQVNSFGSSITDIAFSNGDTPVILNSNTLTSYTPSLLPIGSLTIAYSPLIIFANSTDVIAFRFDASSSTGMSPHIIPLSSFSPPLPGAVVDPRGLAYSPDRIEVGADGRLLIFSKANHSIFRWDPATQLYGETIPLVGRPDFMSYSQSTDTVYLAYPSGLIRQIRLGDENLSEVPFATLPGPPNGLSMAGSYVFAVDSSGQEWSHYTFATTGDRIDAVDLNWYSTDYVWSETNQKMYLLATNFFGDLAWEAINADGSTYPGEPPGGISGKQDSMLHDNNGSNFLHPIRISPDGGYVVLGSGILHNATTLARLPVRLSNFIADAVWLGSELFTLNATPGYSNFQHWAQPAFVIDRSTQRVGQPIALKAISDDRLVGVLMSSGGIPFFTVFDANFNETSLNEPPVDLSLQASVISLIEHTAVPSPITVASFSFSDDGRGASNVSLSGPDAAKFELAGNTIRLKAGSILDYEATPSLRVIVNIDDPNVGASPDLSAEYVLTLIDINEPPTDITLANRVTSLPENSDTSSGIRVADIVIADDALGTNHVTLSGQDAASFEIIGDELRLRTGVLLNFESKSSYSVTVRVDDPSIGSTPDAVTGFQLTVLNVNEAPTAVRLQNVVSSLAENLSTSVSRRVADIFVTDDFLGLNVLSVTGPDASAFQVSSGSLRLRAGTVLNYEAKSSYTVDVNVDDASVGGTPDASVPFTLNITDINEAPSELRFNALVASIEEDTDTTTGVHLGDLAVMDDLLGTNVLSLSGFDADLLEIVGTQLWLKAGALLDAENHPLISVTVNVDDVAVGLSPDRSLEISISVLTAPLTALIGRHLFYNNSRFDDPQFAGSDDLAIAADKQALLPGQTATFANYTSYNRGINGLMIDIENLAGVPTVDDFAFRVGNDENVGNLQPLEVLPEISIRPGAGVNGSDRLTLVWPDLSITKTWLQVTVKATENTGLDAPDVFYFGNAVGESGNVPGDPSVSITDELLARNNPMSINPGAGVTNRFDYNRDGTVSVVDQLLARNNITTAATKLKLLTPPENSSPAQISQMPLTAQAFFDAALADQQPVAPGRETAALVPSAGNSTQPRSSATKHIPPIAYVDAALAMARLPKHAVSEVLDDELLELICRTG